MCKELEALKELKYVHDTECGEDKSVNERFALIENALKALEIIKEKNIDVRYFVDDFVKQDYGWDLYDDYSEQYHYGKDDFSRYDGEYLTKEQFELLKEILV